MTDLLIVALAVLGAVAAIYTHLYLEWRAWDKERRFKRRIFVSLARHQEAILQMSKALSSIGSTVAEATRAFKAFNKAFAGINEIAKKATPQ